MFQSLTLFQTAYDMARHAGARQALIARNMANSDTPGYRPTDLRPFAETLAEAPGAGLRATRGGHLSDAGAPALRPSAATGEAAPNGNAVNIEEEMMRSVEAQRQHDRALAIYRSGLRILRAGLGKT